MDSRRNVKKLRRGLRLTQGCAIHAARIRQYFIRREADFPPALHACRQAGARLEQARTYGFGTWPVNSRRISVSLALILAAFSPPRRIMIF